eukprot:3000838-Prymnesium_polylepis.1
MMCADDGRLDSASASGMIFAHHPHERLDSASGSQRGGGVIGGLQRAKVRRGHRTDAARPLHVRRGRKHSSRLRLFPQPIETAQAFIRAAPAAARGAKDTRREARNAAS